MTEHQSSPAPIWPLHIVFDGPPSHESGRFVEVNDSTGKSVNAGEWVENGQFWELIINKPRGQRASLQDITDTIADALQDMMGESTTATAKHVVAQLSAHHVFVREG